MKLLIVDDQISVHRYLNKAIRFDELNFHEVYHAYNGREALQIIQEENPDIMLLDIEMPEINGLNVLKEISMSQLSIYTIVLSAYAQFEYAQQALKYGACDYTLKPIDPVEINEKLKHFMEDSIKIKKKTLYSQMLSLISASAANFAVPVPDNLLDEIGIRQYCLFCTHSQFSWSIPEEFGTVLFQIQQNCEIFYFFKLSEILEQAAYCSWLESCFKSQFQNAQSQPNIGISRLYSDAAHLKHAVKEARYALFQTFYISGISFYQQNFFSSPSDKIPYYGSVMKAIKEKDSTNLLYFTEKLFDFFFANQIYPLTAYEICYRILAVLDSYASSFVKFSPEESFEETFQYIYPNINTLKEHFMKVLLLYMDQNHANAEIDEVIIKNIKSYIDEHCENDLSLDTVASAFFINKYQISRIFKKIYKVNYQDYCLKVRLEKTCWLLRNTNLKLYEVAQQTGFKEVSYLSNVFKKKYQMTLKEYRNQNKQT